MTKWEHSSLGVVFLSLDELQKEQLLGAWG